MPRRDSHSTAGSMAIDSSQASSSRSRNDDVAVKAHTAIHRATIEASTVKTIRRTLAEGMAIHCGWCSELAPIRRAASRRATVPCSTPPTWCPPRARAPGPEA